MNELLKRLSLEAGGSHYPNINPELQKKFAELIVQKCADIGERYADGNYEVRNQILIHFGLEEPEE